MTSTENLQHHLILCQELHQLALEENQFLKTRQRTPDADLLDRKRTLLAQLDASLTALKAGNQSQSPSSPYAQSDPARKDAIEKARAKILQILHLDRENEQLLLRYSLGAPRRGAAAAPLPATAAPSQVQRLYERLR